MKRALQLVEQSVVNWEAEVPRVTRSDLTAPKFASMCDIAKAAVAYYAHLKAKYHSVWEAEPQIERCFARMCIQGDNSVTHPFQAAYEHCSGHVSRLDMRSMAPDSDWANALRSLQTRLDALTPPAAEGQVPAAPLTAPMAPAAAAAEDPEGPGAQQATMAAVPTPGAEDRRRRHRDLVMTTKLSEAHMALEDSITLFVGAPREPAQARLGNCVLTIRMASDKSHTGPATTYRDWGLPVSSAAEASMCLPAITSPTLFIIPTRVTARCRTSAMRALPKKCMGALHAAAKQDILLVSVGHDVYGQAWPAYQSMPTAQIQAVAHRCETQARIHLHATRSNLSLTSQQWAMAMDHTTPPTPPHARFKKFDTLKGFSWTGPCAVFQLRSRGARYTEYYMVGAGPEAPKTTHVALAWLWAKRAGGTYGMTPPCTAIFSRGTSCPWHASGLRGRGGHMVWSRSQHSHS